MKDFSQYGNRPDDQWEMLPWIPDPRPPFKIWVKPEQIAPFFLVPHHPYAISLLLKISDGFRTEEFRRLGLTGNSGDWERLVRGVIQEFPAVDIDGTLYRDGGVSDNTPVKPLYDIGIRRFIVSYLGSGGADLSNFPGAEFIELFPSDEIFLGKRENSVIAPGTLDFDGENAALRIELGRRETLEQLSETDLSSFLPANISG